MIISGYSFTSPDAPVVESVSIPERFINAEFGDIVKARKRYEKTKQWRETTDQDVKATAIENYKAASRSLINYINEFIKNEDFKTIDPAKMKTIKQGLGKFYDYYSALKPEEFGPDTLDGSSIKFGMKKIFQNLFTQIKPDDYELG